MPGLTAPLLSLDASGTIAKTLTYSKWKGIKYVRQRVIPANPRTATQTDVRNVFANLNAWWLYVPTYILASYTEFARGKPLTNRNGWIQRNAAALYAAADLDDIALYVPVGGAPSFLVDTSTPAATTITIGIVPPTSPTGWTVVRTAAAAIQIGDPTTLLTRVIHEGTDASTPYTSNVITGLVTATHYRVQGAILWLKPNGESAWSVSPSFDQLTS